MKTIKQIILFISLILMIQGCGSSPTADRSDTLPAKPTSTLYYRSDIPRSKSRVYDEPCVFPSTRADWESVGVPVFSSEDILRAQREEAKKQQSSLPDATGSVSFLAARTGKTGLDAAHLTVNGVPGSHIDLGLPIFVQLKGSVDQGKSTNLTTGTVAYKLDTTLIGAIQTYSNSGSGFGIDGRQLESFVVASHSFGSFFIEGQFGSIAATEVHFKDWSGSRAQLTVGVDTSWVSPFVQVSYRNLNDQPDTAVYGGLEVDLSELKTDGYTVSTHLLTKAGYSNVKGTTGALEWSGTLTLNSGLSFSTNFTIGTAAEPSAGLTFKLDR
jgi:hypothetical protein